MPEDIRNVDLELDLFGVDVDALDQQTEYLLKRMQTSNGALRKRIWAMLSSKLGLGNSNNKSRG